MKYNCLLTCFTITHRRLPNDIVGIEFYGAVKFVSWWIRGWEVHQTCQTCPSRRFNGECDNERWRRRAARHLIQPYQRDSEKTNDGINALRNVLYTSAYSSSHKIFTNMNINIDLIWCDYIKNIYNPSILHVTSIRA